MDSKIVAGTAVAFLATAAGCGTSAPDSSEQEPPPKSLVMQGRVSPAFVGKWKYILGNYVFGADGKYDVHFDYMRPSGPGRGDTHVVGDETGTWSADDRDIYFKSSRGDVIKDAFKFSDSGSTLDLSAKYSKSPQTLHRDAGGKAAPR